MSPADRGPLFCDLAGRRLSDGAMDRLAARLRARSGVARFRWHLLRHTAGTESLRNGADSLDVQEALGHARPMMTRRYLHLTDDDRRERHARYSPVEALLGPPAPAAREGRFRPGAPAPRCGSRGGPPRLSAGPGAGRRPGPRATGGGVLEVRQVPHERRLDLGRGPLAQRRRRRPHRARGLRGGAPGGEDAQHLRGLRGQHVRHRLDGGPQHVPQGAAGGAPAVAVLAGRPLLHHPQRRQRARGPPAGTGRPGRAGPP